MLKAALVITLETISDQSNLYNFLYKYKLLFNFRMTLILISNVDVKIGSEIENIFIL